MACLKQEDNKMLIMKKKVKWDSSGENPFYEMIWEINFYYITGMFKGKKDWKFQVHRRVYR